MAKSQESMQVVAAVIKDAEGKVLITQRGKGMDFEGKWEFPGGKVDNGEDLVAALKREISEELNVEIEVGRKLMDWIYKYPFAAINFFAFSAEITKGEVTLTEHMDMKWIEISLLSDYDWVPADVELVKGLVGGLL
ncbi:MAG: (deoxy)nucleoside triphosphate pyrophosphohydrolase [Pseudomonadota bacterium]